MTLRYVLDTNVVSELVRPAPDASVVKRVSAATGTLAIAAPCWHELWFGAERLSKSRRRSALFAYLERFSEGVTVVPYDAEAALWQARERARLEARGRVVPFVDTQIAAIAASRGLTLVTRNIRDFEAFDDLSVVCWHA